MQQQRGDADKLFNLGQCILIFIGTVELVTGGLRQTRQILQCLLALFAQRRAFARGQAEAAKEGPAPLEQGVGARLQRFGRIGQHQFKGEVMVFQLRHGGHAQTVQCTARLRGLHVVVGQYLGRPGLQVGTTTGQPTGQAAVEFSRGSTQAQRLAGLDNLVDDREFAHVTVL
ncbi:hypothetical protein D3C81_1054580 [compost metagenome]